MDDSEIVELYLKRDETAIAHTAQKYGHRLKMLANRILNDLSSAEECENETYMQTWNLIPPNEPRTYLFPFLGRITRHLAIDEYRKSRTLKREGTILELTKEMGECIPAGRGVDDRINAEMLTEYINTFLESCSEDQQNVFVRRYWYFDTIPEICRRYGFSTSKVKTMLFRMRERLRQHLEKEGYDI